MSRYIISQFFETFAFIIAITQYHFKDKNKIMKASCLSNVFDIIHYFYLKEYSGMYTKIIAFIRNSFIIKKSKYKNINNDVFLIIFIILYIIAGIISYKNIFSILPIIAAIIYLVKVWSGSTYQIKKVALFCYILWIIYNICIMSAAGIIANITLMISTYIAYRKENKNQYLIK